MHIKFLESGESPDIGTYKKGEERDLPADIANRFISRGIVIANETKQSHKSKIKEVDDNGRQ